jgi:hypothetical protein
MLNIVTRRVAIRPVTVEEDQRLRAAAREFALAELGFALPPVKKMKRMQQSEHDYLTMLLRGPNQGHGWTKQKVRHRHKWFDRVKEITGEPQAEFVWESNLCHTDYIEKETSK